MFDCLDLVSNPLIPLLAQSPPDTAHHGFLPTRGSFMLDFVFVAMFGVMIVMAWSIYLVKYKQRYELHKRVQIVLGVVLAVAVTAFEVDMRFITKDWESLALASPYWESGWVKYTLWIHLCFAIPTPFLWIYVIVQGIRKFPSPATPNEYSGTHLKWAKPAAVGMLLTSLTGWVFYYLAFVA